MKRKLINWEKIHGLLPAIVQHAQTGRVLMLGYMNQEALLKTLKTEKVWFFSRTKKRLWMKGETSGNYLSCMGMELDCDGDTMLVRAIPSGPTCHNGKDSCFAQDGVSNVFAELFGIIEERKKNMPRKSYTALLLKGGIAKICEKIDEESREVIRAARRESKKRLTEESVDLLYHLFVLCAARSVGLSDISTVIRTRDKLR